MMVLQLGKRCRNGVVCYFVSTIADVNTGLSSVNEPEASATDALPSLTLPARWCCGLAEDGTVFANKYSSGDKRLPQSS
jgi:hypothetical protein